MRFCPQLCVPRKRCACKQMRIIRQNIKKKKGASMRFFPLSASSLPSPHLLNTSNPPPSLRPYLPASPSLASLTSAVHCPSAHAMVAAVVQISSALSGQMSPLSPNSAALSSNRRHSNSVMNVRFSEREQSVLAPAYTYKVSRAQPLCEIETWLVSQPRF